MQVYVFLDLDDTVFQTRRKCPDASMLHVAARGRDGTPLSFMTEKQRVLFDWIGREAQLIPTTARSLEAFRRVALSFAGPAVLDFGGAILDKDGALDPGWDCEIREQMVALRAPLHEVHAAIVETAKLEQLSVRSRIINDFDMDMYVVTKQASADADHLRRLYELTAGRFAKDLFYVHFNDNNLAVIPRCVNKRRAVQYLIDHRLRAKDCEVVTIGMGDSTSDLDFMATCDYCLTPRGSQINRLLTDGQHV